MKLQTMEMSYKYFISYVCTKDGVSEYGNLVSNSSKEIEGMEDIERISRSIENGLSLEEKSVVIINFINLNR